MQIVQSKYYSMIRDYSISIYLDIRRLKANGKYPVKLRVYDNVLKHQKLLPTSFEFTKDEFSSIWETLKPRGVNKELQIQLKALENKAIQTAESLSEFTIENLEDKLYNRRLSNKNDVSHWYSLAIEQYSKNSQIGTASNYELSIKSLLEFHKKNNLNFNSITPQWLRDYERYMVEIKKRSRTTVGIYLRPLRAIFNTVIAQKIINPDQYPFGKRKYTIPAPKSTKKALSKEQLKILFETEPKTQDQRRAKAFWFFSYSCNGMNFKDIAYLQYKNIDGDTLQFRRAKTSNTNSSQAPVIVYLNEYTKSVIDIYGNRIKSPDQYVFSIIDHKSAPEERHRQLKNFIRYINQHFGSFAQELGIEEHVSSYWARHSFATQAIRNGASMEYVSEALSHSNLTTTRNYFAGFEDEKKKEISKKMMEF